MMTWLGLAIVIVTIYFLFKRYDARLILLASGIIMACIAGNPMESLNSFAKNMTNGGLIQAVCSVMGFAMVMRYTECDKHLINSMAKGLSRFRPFLIPGVVIGTYAVNVALPSAAGTAAAAGAIFVPLMMSTGIHPAMAAAAVKCGTYGSMLNPGLAHNPFVAKIAGVDVMDVISFHYKANIASLIVAAILITLTAYYLKEHKGYKAEGLQAEANFKVNFLYALMPILPIAILILGSTGLVPVFKMGVPQAMVIGAAVALLATRKNPVELSNAFFDGMGKAYGTILGIIISAGVFVSGLTAMGVVKSFMDVMLNNPAIVKVCAAVGPFLLGLVVGSGDAATFAFNEAITPHAAEFGLSQVQMGSMATLGGTLGRTMSPIAGATIIVAGIAGVNPMEIAKRNCLPMVGAMIVGMFVLLM
ncbi:C4-dicarboxylate transporter DcuC [Anaerosinus massiliensis]|uniref:C4-dicarboxylate transporter DcuC n=1 Tax=Massilibacillus massiliensis TaxID=1806837 RepID=UPI000A5F5107|nr:C4-dicarboxylate transporter DcuC [Massilibacillus massiliensis]